MEKKKTYLDWPLYLALKRSFDKEINSFVWVKINV